MSLFVDRTCTEVGNEARGSDNAESEPLSAFSDCGGYVLLGAPGSGKTRTFRHEAKGKEYCDARDFMTYDPEHWSGVKTLFIDALDEVRAGLTDGRLPLDAIRGKLEKLGRPRFRLSCREADWFGATDRRRLESVSPDGVVKVLRLDPLADSKIREILRSKAVGDVDGFIHEARCRGIGALLSNPQTLELLALAVAGGNWPKTRTATFEIACESLIREHNQEHRQSTLDRPDSKLLDTAGRLCAVQLLTGCTGYRQPKTTANDGDCIDLRDIPSPNCASLLAALRTSVFDVADGLIAPVHRHIAEFLAGRYLSSRIDAGLPARRILALVTGENGRAVSALRGLAAWLAAHSEAARGEVVERDPLGTVLYGDVSGFSADWKRRLLDCLERDAERDPRIFAAVHDLDSRWGDLATPDMKITILKILTAPAGGQGRQTIALAVLKSLERGAVIPGLVSRLPKVMRDGGCWPAVREAALDAYIQQCRDAGDAPHALKALLDEVYAGSISDPLDNLLGRLLRELYPGTVSPAEVGRYLREPNRAVFIGLYAWFWKYDVAERSTDEQLAEILDFLAKTCSDGERTGEHGKSLSCSYWLRTVPANLLGAYLDRFPTVGDEQMFAWLSLPAKDEALGAEDKIRAWLRSNPASYKAVVRLAADRYSEWNCLIREIDSRLFIADEPADFGEWCLAQAAGTTTSTKAATDFFLRRVVVLQDNEGISEEIVEDRLAHEPRLLAEYQRLRQQQKHDTAESTSRSIGMRQRRQAEARQRRKEWHGLVKAQESALRENRAAPDLLHHLAAAYLGRFTGVHGATGRLRLRYLLDDDHLVDTVIEAFRASATRTDLPDESELLCLAEEREQHLLSLPFLVGLQEQPSLRPGEPPLNEQDMRRALTCRFEAPELWNQKPGWYRRVLNSRPDLAADVLIRSVRAALRRGANDCLGLSELIRDDDSARVARLAAPPLLASFPTRCKVEQLNVLRLLLHAAFRHVDHDALLQIVESRLVLSSMDSAQRLYWLCAGLLTAPASFTARLRSALTGRSSERRIRRMAEFLRECTFDALDVAALELLIESLGNTYRPYGWPDDGSRTGTVTTGSSIHTALIVDGLIDRLSSEPSRDAAAALERLSAEAALRPWQLKLRESANRQREACREADFLHPTVEQALATLDNLRPANAADLAALTLDVLRDLARDIRDGDTSPWRKYWNVDSCNRPDKPRPENACRDTLLSDLKKRLESLGVDAWQEGTCADDKRADIRVSHGDFNVPVEIKKSDHRELWTAIHRQLIGQYARDPGANGYGIYLVFWFGGNRCKKPHTGPLPESPVALEERLVAEAAAGLSPLEMRKIGVCVIDVSKPDP